MREKLKLEIENTLKLSSKFDNSDFELKFDSKKFRIIYKYSNDPYYYFECQIPNSRSTIEYKVDMGISAIPRTKTKEVYIYNGEMIPGEISNLEKFTSENFKDMTDNIYFWMKNLYDELNIKANMEQDDKKDLTEFVEKFEKYIDDFSFEDVKFTEIEKKEIYAKFDEVEKRYAEMLNRMENLEKTMDEELLLFRNEIEVLKDSTRYLTKKNWLKKYSAKIIDLYNNTSNKQKAVIIGKSFMLMCKCLNIEIVEEVPALIELVDSIEQ